MAKKKRRIAVVTGSRSEFGILYWVIKKLKDSPDIDCQLIVTGSHLAVSQGETVNQIKQEGFKIDAMVPMLLDGDNNEQIGYSMGLGVIGITKEFERLKSDIVVILGDRFEIFSVAIAAMAMQIPIAHIAGGETDWANCIDGNIRNAITKMSHLHFVSHELYGERVKAMGEEGWRIHNVGLPSLDYITDSLMTRGELENSLDIKFKETIFLVTYLPIGLRLEESMDELNEMLLAIEKFKDDVSVIFTLSNADAGGREVNKRIIEFSRSINNIHVYNSLGKHRYLSMINICDVVIGNSSSGIIETASFKKPTVNVGIRQAGRIHPDNVINVNGKQKEILTAIKKALYDDEFNKRLDSLINPFGDGHSSERIVKVLSETDLNKNFFEKRLNLIKEQ